MNIEELRTNIDKKDDEIIKLLNERLDLSRQVAEYKGETGKAIHDGLREREILKKVGQMSESEHEKYARIIYNTIIATSRSYQYSITDRSDAFKARLLKAADETAKTFPSHATVACQGIPGAYSEAAAHKMFDDPDVMFLSSFEKVFMAVEKGLCRYGVLPIENSNYGSLGSVYDLMTKHNFYLVRSTKYHVRNKLLAKPGTKLEDVKEVFSHEQALGQCQTFLDRLRDTAATAVDNTAVAARMVSESDRKDIAAISSAECAQLYGLEVLADDIQVSGHNYTRFVCISKDMEIYPGDNKVSFMQHTSHRPMSLYHVIGVISATGVNICKLESRPVPGSDFEFGFFFDLDASIQSPEVLSVLSELESAPEYFSFLGAYQEV